MSHSPISRSDDLRRLEAEGYEIEVRSGHLLMRSVPYITSRRTVGRGTLVASLTLEGDVTGKPDDHVAKWSGEVPCDSEGSPLNLIIQTHERCPLGEGIVVDHSFSRKPPQGYEDYYEMMTTYANIISGPVHSIDPNATARTFAAPDQVGDDSVFKYADTASSRAGITAISEKLNVGAVAIVGLGGTGSYILDLVAKTPVAEIHLFDGDLFGQHNAFRSPGAPHVEELRSSPTKSEYFKKVYSNIRRNIVAHGSVEDDTVMRLKQMAFVFIAVDQGRSRRLVVDRLKEFGVPFIDVGMGVLEVDGTLTGQLRVTISTNQDRDRLREVLPLADHVGVDDYSSNIQTADLNALNAALAVIRWKKQSEFYADSGHEQSSVYQIDCNHIVNE